MIYNSFFHLVNEPASRRSVFATVFVLCHYYPNIIQRAPYLVNRYVHIIITGMVHTIALTEDKNIKGYYSLLLIIPAIKHWPQSLFVLTAKSWNAFFLLGCQHAINLIRITYKLQYGLKRENRLMLFSYLIRVMVVNITNLVLIKRKRSGDNLSQDTE